MSEPKPFASLSSGLLARKGAARPAMRPQGFGQAGQSLEDLGWDDMGFEPPTAAEIVRDPSHDAFGDDLADHPRVHPTGLTPVSSPTQTPVQSPVPSPVHSQQAEIAERVAEFEQADADAEVEDSAELVEPEADYVPEPEAEGDAPVEAASEIPAAVVTPFRAKTQELVQPRRAPAPRSAPGSKAKAAFTLRLDPDRHFKLRLACAVDGRSAQHIVTDALDQMLAKMPELEGMAAKAKRKG